MSYLISLTKEYEGIAERAAVGTKMVTRDYLKKVITDHLDKCKEENLIKDINNQLRKDGR